jgi:hypothetical protein
MSGGFVGAGAKADPQQGPTLASMPYNARLELAAFRADEGADAGPSTMEHYG